MKTARSADNISRCEFTADAVGITATEYFDDTDTEGHVLATGLSEADAAVVAEAFFAYGELEVHTIP